MAAEEMVVAETGVEKGVAEMAVETKMVEEREKVAGAAVATGVEGVVVVARAAAATAAVAREVAARVAAAEAVEVSVVGTATVGTAVVARAAVAREEAARAAAARADARVVHGTRVVYHLLIHEIHL